MKYQWSRPYYGLSHCTPGPPIRQMTVCAHDTTTHGYILLDGGGFTPAIEQVFTGEGHTERAKAWLEEKAEAFLGGRAPR